MEDHLHALGYLLAALTFSVGFLSTRIHSNLDSTLKIVSERSWGFRLAISEGVQMGPVDIAELLRVVRRSRDYIAVGSRVLNLAIFATTCVVFCDAVGLHRDGTPTPQHGMLVLYMLFAASVAVVVFAEFDVRRVAVQQRQEIAATTLGRLQRLAQMFEHCQFMRAARELSDLRDTFPSWGFLIELEAYCDLERGKPGRGLQRIEKLLQSDCDLYVSPVVGAACCLQSVGLDQALYLLERIERRAGRIPHLGYLRRAMAVSAGHLPALLAGSDTAVPTDSERGQATLRSVTLRLIGQDLEHRHDPVRSLGLDIDPAKLQQTAHLIGTLERWESDDKLSDFMPEGALARMLRLILETTDAAGVAVLVTADGQRHDPLTLESFGLAALACGESRVALSFLESAIRAAPASARSHWGHAIACCRLGWLDAASASLRRAETLDEDAPVLSVTRRLLLESPAARIRSNEVLGAYPVPPTNLDRFELALLGVDVPPEQGPTVRERFSCELIRRALDSVDPQIASKAA